jgi:transposase
MGSSLPLTREMFDVIYAQGQDALFSFVSDLHARVVALEEQAAKNSSNSSKPPSSDGLSKKPLEPMTASLRKKTGKKVGGQPGHAGTTLTQVDQPDEVVVHRLDICPTCQADLATALPVSQSRRQVFEMPDPRVVVTEHQAVTLTCPACGKGCAASFPFGVEQPVQYGPNLLGFATYLHGVHLVPFARCAQIVQDITSAPFSPGSLARALQAAYTKLQPFEEAVQTVLAKVPVKHVDETGSRVSGKLNWFHVRCTKTLSWLFCHEKRGGTVAAGDLQEYTGTLVSDFWSTYVRLGCQHVFCGAHLLRELTFLHEVNKQMWAGELIMLFEDAVSACHRARDRGAKALWCASRLAREFDGIIKRGLQTSPHPDKKIASRVRCLLERLTRHRDDYLRFTKNLMLPFTNNEAERDLRMLKVKGKISGGFRTKEGADNFCRLRSYATTCRKQEMPLLDCIRSLFQNQIIMPKLVPE